MRRGWQRRSNVRTDLKTEQGVQSHEMSIDCVVFVPKKSEADALTQDEVKLELVQAQIAQRVRQQEHG